MTLGICDNKQEVDLEDILNKETKMISRKAIGVLNLLFGEDKTRRETKRGIYKSMMERVVVFRAKVWDVIKKNKQKLLAKN